MKCLVVNLDRSVDRLPHVVQEFEKNDLTFERVSAVDWHDLKDINLNELTKRSVKFKKLTYPAIACFLSHRKCWQLIVDGLDEYVAIFEDDVILSQKAKKFLDDVSWIPHGANIIKIETEMFPILTGSQIHRIDDEHALRILKGQHNGTCGYIVSRTYAKYLLSISEKLYCQVDVFLFDPRAEPMRENVVYQMAPAICIQKQFYANKKDDFESTIMVKQRHIKGAEKGLLSKLSRELKRPVLKNILYFYDHSLPQLSYILNRKKLSRIIVDFN
nr:glycosyltransferase family 25 protein [Agrobacterium rubi]